MRPNGCFGSSLAFEPKSDTCKACPEMKACKQITDERRPTILKLLSKFSDWQGNPMSHHWMTTAEKRALTKDRKANARREHEIQVYGSEQAAQELRDRMNKRAHPIFERMTRVHINLVSDKLDTLAAFDRQMATIIALLRKKPCTTADLTDALVSKFNKSVDCARLDALARTSILVAAGRAKRTNDILELT